MNWKLAPFPTNGDEWPPLGRRWPAEIVALAVDGSQPRRLQIAKSAQQNGAFHQRQKLGLNKTEQTKTRRAL